MKIYCDYAFMTDGVKGAEDEKVYTFTYGKYNPGKIRRVRHYLCERSENEPGSVPDKQHRRSVPGLRKRKRKSAKHSRHHDKCGLVVQKRKDDFMPDGNWRDGMNPEQETICRARELFGWRLPCRGCVYNTDKFTCSDHFKEDQDNGNQQEQEGSKS